MRETLASLGGNPNLNRALFDAAYGAKAQVEAMRLKAQSESLLLPIVQAQHARVATAIAKEIELGHTPEVCTSNVEWCTSEEKDKALDAILQMFDTEYELELILAYRELDNVFQSMKTRAQELLYALYTEETLRREQSPIISPNGLDHKPGTIITL